MKSGNKKVFLGALALLGFAVADGDRPTAPRKLAADGTGTFWIAPELVDSQPRALATALPAVVKFEWNPESGELTYTTDRAAGVTRLEDLVGRSPDSDRNPRSR